MAPVRVTWIQYHFSAQSILQMKGKYKQVLYVQAFVALYQDSQEKR